MRFLREISDRDLAASTERYCGQYDNAEVWDFHVKNVRGYKLFIIRLFCLAFAGNRPMGITGEKCPSISQSERSLYTNTINAYQYRKCRLVLSLYLQTCRKKSYKKMVSWVENLMHPYNIQNSIQYPDYHSVLSRGIYAFIRQSFLETAVKRQPSLFLCTHG